MTTRHATPGRWIARLVVLLCLLFDMTFASRAFAADPPQPSPADAAGPVHVKVGLYVLNVGKFDLGSGTFTVDFYLSLRSDRDMGDQRFEFMNGRGTVDKLIDTPTEKFFRYQGNLMTNLNLQAFPFDSHVLPITIEHVTRTTKELVYDVDDAQTGIDSEVTFVGWQLKGYSAVSRVHSYPVYQESYSQYSYRLKIGRLVFITSLKTFLPVLCFLLITFVSLLMVVEKLDGRLGMNTAMLIASVMFHIAITGSLPPLGYLTMADKVLIATYSTIGVNLVLTVIMLRQVTRKEEEKAKALRERSFLALPAFAVFAYAVAILSP